jgi:hypothetical protein
LEEQWEQVEGAYHAVAFPQGLASRGPGIEQEGEARRNLAAFNAAAEAIKHSPVTAIILTAYSIATMVKNGSTGPMTAGQHETFKKILVVGSGLEAVATGAAMAVATFRNNRQGAKTPKGATGPASGRPFDPSKAGGPIRTLSTQGVKVTPKGIDAVEGHLARFGPDEANAGMVDRLRRISAGKLDATSSDLNFYTHELRESVRYRQLGHRTGAGDDYDLWNNAHTGTLEDYNLKEGPGVLYHPEVKK